MTDIQASLGIHQLAKLEKFQAIREKYAKLYNNALKYISGITIPYVRKDVHHAWHLYTILVDSELLGISRAQFIEALKKENIGTSVHFIPLHLHPYYQETCGYKKGDFPNTEYIYDRIVSLPLYPLMTEQDVQDVIIAIKNSWRETLRKVDMT
jgi:dTDP-4-amino-4,6-dideoxygalactose transaminase